MIDSWIDTVIWVGTSCMKIIKENGVFVNDKIKN